MRKIDIRVEANPSLNNTEVIIRTPALDAETEALMKRISSGEPELLTVTDTDGSLRRISQNEIVSVSVLGKQVQIVTENNSYCVQQSLQSLENELDSGKFVRISRHELVNPGKVVKYDFTLSGTLRLELVGGMETWASRRCIPAIRKWLNGKE